MPVYLGARDLSGMFIGTHQFLVIVNNKLLTPRQLGNGKVKAKFLGIKNGKTIYGIVIGAHNRGTLNVEAFERSDNIAAQEFFGGIETHFYKSDFDTEMYEVKFNVLEQIAIENILYRIDSYLINQLSDPIKYPTAGFGHNSNSWAQSVIEYAGGTVVENVSGADIYSERRIPKTYFDAICPVNRRPKVN